MDHQCPICSYLVNDDVYHEHLEKCRKLVKRPPKKDRDIPTFNAPTSGITPLSLNPPEQTRRAGIPSWNCCQCNRDFALKEEFSAHLQSMDHRRNSNNEFNETIYSTSPAVDLLADSVGRMGMQPKTALNAPPPLLLRENEMGPQASRPINQNEIRSIVREEIAKYFRQLLQIVESDMPAKGGLF